VHQSNPKGHPDNPMSDREIADKFLKQADAASLPEAQSRELLNRLWDLDKQTDLKPVFSLMQLPSA
jgi:2-methylcitrate dehydratase